MSIGIPTYNRAALFERALESAIAQKHDNIEIVISDNASTDGTHTLCMQAAADDPRVRFVQQTTNIGATANYRAVLENATGEFFMWLADDDWLDNNYVSECLSYLTDHQDFALVAGKTSFVDADGRVERQGSTTVLEQNLPEERVLSFYDHVDDCAVFYGIARRELMLTVKLDHTVGEDWHMVASLAAAGKVATLETTTIYRSIEGASKDLSALVAYYGLKGSDAAHPHVIIAKNSITRILWQSRPFRIMPFFKRAKLSIRVYGVIYRRFCMWDATPPPLSRRLSLRLHRWALIVGRRASRAW